MKCDVFLYSRTRTYDYTDMYMPSWFTNNPEMYSEYRKIVSHIFKIRDMIPESSYGLLQNTSNNFVFIRGSKISMLCRFCHIVGVDEFKRPICSTEGYICQNDDLKEFWLSIPDMIINLLGEDLYYNQYMAKNAASPKPVQMNYVTEIRHFIDTYSTFRIDDDIKEFLDSRYILYQYEIMLKTIQTVGEPFNFAIGTENRELYCYKPSVDVPLLERVFCSSFCPEPNINDSWTKKYTPTKINIDPKKYNLYLELKKSDQNRLRYRLLVASEPQQENLILDIPFVTYEQETGTEIKFSEILKMYKTAKIFIEPLGYEQSEDNRYIFEKR